MTSILDLSHRSDADQRENGLRQHISYDLLSNTLLMCKILKWCPRLKKIRDKTVYYMLCGLSSGRGRSGQTRDLGTRD
jgi:hypothetical protein